MNIERPIFANSRAADLAYDPVQFFDGRVLAGGFISDRLSRVRRSFTIEFVGKRQDNQIEIVEAMTFNDGELLHRVWNIAAQSPGVWLAHASDIPGPIKITTGTHPGEGRWHYHMALPIAGRQITFAFEDVMVKTSPTDITAVTYIRKFGILAAQIFCHYQRQSV